MELFPEQRKEYTAIHLCVYVVYGTWFLSLREEHKLRVFEHKVLKGILSWRRLRNEDLNSFNSLPDIIGVIKSRWIRWVGNVERWWTVKSLQKLSVKPERRSRLGTPICGWEDRIKMDLRKTRGGALSRHVTLDRERWPVVLNSVFNIRFP
jgi:hypothetical protein